MNTIVVTGATSGIGFAVSMEILKKGYRLIGTGRSKQSCDKTIKLLAENAFISRVCSTGPWA